MTDQMASLVEALTKVADGMEHIGASKYTITGAADWPILACMGVILTGLLGLLWKYLDKSFEELKIIIKDHRGEWRVELDKHMLIDKEEKNLLWSECREIRGNMEKCKEKCYDG